MKPLNRDHSILEHIVSYCEQIEAMRNIVAHSYGTIDPEVTWEVMTENIPALKSYCHNVLTTELS